MGRSPCVRRARGEGPNGHLPRQKEEFKGLQECGGKRWGLPAEAPSLKAMELERRLAGCANPDEFISTAFSMSSPFSDSEIQFPDHVRKAIRLRTSLGSRVASWRLSQLASLRSVAEAYPPRQGPRWDVLAAFLRKAGSLGRTLWEDSKGGFMLVGEIPRSRRWEPLPEAGCGVASKLSSLVDAHAAERAEGTWRLPSYRREGMLGILRAEASGPTG